jgi:pimeloyl-ACP methyl ester carboxylesterase
MADTDHRDSLASLSAPTLVICGEEDRVTPPKLSAELHEGIPNAVLTSVEAAGHLANKSDLRLSTAKFLNFFNHSHSQANCEH